MAGLRAAPALAWAALALAGLAEGSIWLRRDDADCSQGTENTPLPGMDPVSGGDYTVDECKAMCEDKPLCNAIMVFQQKEKGACWLYMNVRLTECMRSEAVEVWSRIEKQRKPPPGIWENFGNNTVCRINTRDNTLDGQGSVLVYGAPTFDDCKGLCGTTDKCYGVEYEERVFRCEVWTRPIGYVATVLGYICSEYKPKEFIT